MNVIRVLHILHSMNRGGAENAIMNYYRHIDRDKVQFDFLLTEQNKCQFENEIISLGGKVYRIPLLKMSNPFPYLRAVSSFFDKHPEYKIVHSHTSSKSVFPLWIAEMKGIPMRIAHSHNTKSEKGLRGWIRNTLKVFLKKVATHFFACGEDAAIWLYGDSYYREGKVRVIPNVIECSNFSFDLHKREIIRQKYQLREDTLVLGCVARFSLQKNLLFALDVFKVLYELYENSVLFLLGDGEMKDQIIHKIHFLGIENNVIMTGVVPNVSDYEQAMDIYLMPSFHEGLPLSLIEAQISGLRCFVSTGIPQEVDKTGLVTFIPIQEGSQKWAEIILLNKEYERRSYYEELMAAGYDAETSAKVLERMYLNMYNQ